MSDMITLMVGDAESRTLTLTSGETSDAQAAVDLSEATEIEFTSNRSGERTLSKTLTGGGITLESDGTDGKIVIAFDATDTATAAEFLWRVVVSWGATQLTFPNTQSRPMLTVLV